MGEDMTNNMADTAPALAGWQSAFCDRYAILLLEYGRWFLLAALIIGIVGAIAAVYLSLKTPPAGGDEGGGSALTSTIDAIKGLIESFSKAPTWLAMLGGALLLLWMAGNSVPDYCVAPGAGSGSNESAPADANGSGNASGEAGNEAAGNAAGNES
jgi:hypothetical protein